MYDEQGGLDRFLDEGLAAPGVAPAAGEAVGLMLAALVLAGGLGLVLAAAEWLASCVGS